MSIHMFSKDDLLNAEHEIANSILFHDTLGSNEEIIGALKGVVALINGLIAEEKED